MTAIKFHTTSEKEKCAGQAISYSDFYIMISLSVPLEVDQLIYLNKLNLSHLIVVFVRPQNIQTYIYVKRKEKKILYMFSVLRDINNTNKINTL